MKKSTMVFGGVVLAVLIAVYVVYRISVPPQAVTLPTNTALPGVLDGLAPWPANQTLLRERLTAIGLPALSEEGNTLHTHQHLDIFLHGVPIEIPEGIGVPVPERFISPVHTHDLDAIIHVESPVIQRFTLGQFFDVWGVRFDDQCLGGYCADADNQLRVYQNGQMVLKNVRDIALTQHQEIAVTFGLSSELPDPIPASFVFPAGL